MNADLLRFTTIFDNKPFIKNELFEFYTHVQLLLLKKIIGKHFT